MNIKHIIAIDIGCEKSVACVVSREAFFTQKPVDFYDSCDFIEFSPNQEGLEQLLALATPDCIFVGEPTGSYSLVWVENIRLRGYDFRLIAHDKVASGRDSICHWKDKDDPHDAVCIGWLAWGNIENPSFFNRVKGPHQQQMLKALLESERLNKAITEEVNRARQLLHHEFPAALEVKRREGSKSKGTKNLVESNKGIPPLVFRFIAGEPLAPASATKILKLLGSCIGSASRTGKFSPELTKISISLCAEMRLRFALNHSLRQMVSDPRYGRENKVFDLFNFDTDTRAVLLVQTYPFSQFLSPDGKQVKITKRRAKRSAKGRLPRKLKSRNLFCAACGKAPSNRSSGKKVGQIVNGPALCRLMLWRWGNVSIIQWNSSRALKNDIGAALREAYEIDKGQGSAILQTVEKLAQENPEQIKVVINTLKQLKDNPLAEAVTKLLEESAEHSEKSEDAPGKASRALTNLIQARISDRAVRLLFRELCKEFCQ